MVERSPFPDHPEKPFQDRTIALALQGGASLGAYVWGVLDALMDDGRLDVEGITGASAGAINAAAFGVGFARGGRAGARNALRDVWEDLSARAARRRRSPLDLVRAVTRYLPRIRSASAFYALTTRLVSDFDIDPDTMEPLRSTLHHTLDLSLLETTDAIKVFLNVTDIQTGEPEVFSGGGISVDAICASCAVPLLFKPVEIRGRWYWDGGLIGNPAIYPVIYGCKTAEIVLVETRSNHPSGTLKTGAEVMARTMDLASVAGLVRELRTIKFVTELRRENPSSPHREIRLHRISSHPALEQLEEARSFRADLPYFHQLRDLGRERGIQWLSQALIDGG